VQRKRFAPTSFFFVAAGAYTTVGYCVNFTVWVMHKYIFVIEPNEDNVIQQLF